MAIRVACWKCGGHLMAETAGVVVACPHCHAHLTIPAQPAAPVSPPVAAPIPAAPAEQPTAAAPVAPSPPQSTMTSPAEVKLPQDVPPSFPDVTAPREPTSGSETVSHTTPTTDTLQQMPAFQQPPEVPAAAPTAPAVPEAVTPPTPPQAEATAIGPEVGSPTPAPLNETPAGPQFPNLAAVSATEPVSSSEFDFLSQLSDTDATSAKPASPEPTAETVSPPTQSSEVATEEAPVGEQSATGQSPAEQPVADASFRSFAPADPASLVNEVQVEPAAPPPAAAAESSAVTWQAPPEFTDASAPNSNDAVPTATPVAVPASGFSEAVSPPVLPTEEFTAQPSPAGEIVPPPAAQPVETPPVVTAQPVSTAPPATAFPWAPAADSAPTVTPIADPTSAPVATAPVTTPTADPPAVVVASNSQPDFSGWGGGSLGNSAGAAITGFSPTPSASPVTTATSPNSTEETKSAQRPRSGLMTMLLFAYAAAVTISFLYLLLSLRNGKPHDLESLPDLKPPKRDGEIALQLVPENAPMAPGHTLRLGESRRFGNILVTPVAVTRGPLQFVHYTGESAKGGRPPTNPVLKLWLRFENVSEDQEIAPLDELLTLTRVPVSHEVGVFRANNFLVPKSAKGDLRQEILVYDMPISWDWMIKGQNLDRELAPGESLETFIPSVEDGVDGLSGPLLWRVQFRKGYNPKSMRGVTTLVEVAFDGSQISADRNRS